MSATQSETFSSKNITVLGGLLLIAIIIGEVVIGPSKDGEVVMSAAETVDDIAMRLKPVVTLEDIRSGKSSSMAAGGDSSAGVAAADNASKTPEQLYQGACFACHGTGAAGAPKLGDAAAWSARVGKGLDTLVTSVVNGMGAMPPKGGSAYDDEQIRAVVEYILDNSQ